MTKSPEEYFKEQDFSVKGSGESGFTSAERAFMEKYMGVSEKDVLASIGLDSEGPAPESVVPDLHEEMSAEESLERMLKESTELLLVGFFIGNQEYVVPTVAVQEVIRTMEIAKLPAAPPSVAGVVNLRGKVTPLVVLRELLEIKSNRDAEDKFIIICRRQGLQIGMLIERVHTMYRVPQADIDWNVEQHLGANVDFVTGLLKLEDQLVGIVSVDKIIGSIIS